MHTRAKVRTHAIPPDSQACNKTLQPRRQKRYGLSRQFEDGKPVCTPDDRVRKSVFKPVSDGYFSQ